MRAGVGITSRSCWRGRSVGSLERTALIVESGFGRYRRMVNRPDLANASQQSRFARKLATCARVSARPNWQWRASIGGRPRTDISNIPYARNSQLIGKNGGPFTNPVFPLQPATPHQNPSAAASVQGRGLATKGGVSMRKVFLFAAEVAASGQ